MRPAAFIIAAVVGATCLLVAAAPLAAPYAGDCTVCHAGPDPSSGFTFRMPHLVFSSPVVAPPNWTMKVTLTVHHPGHYRMKDMHATLSVGGDGSLAYFEKARQALPALSASGGMTSCSWTILSGNVTGTVFLAARLNFTASYDHAGNAQDNERGFSLAANREMAIRPSVLFVSEGYLMMGGEGPDEAAFGIVPAQTAKNVTIRLSGNLRPRMELVPAFIGKLASNNRQDINVSLDTGSGAVDNGRIDITWENETGFKDSTFLAVDIMAARVVPAPPGSEPLRLTGRVSGMLSLGLLIFSIVLGAVNVGGDRRVRVHCAVSWFIVGLALYHGLMLVWGPYSRVMWGNFLVLGYVSAAFMGVSGANGLLQRWMSGKAGYRAWLWTHRITLVAAVLLVAVHALALGTDFSFARAMAGGG